MHKTTYNTNSQIISQFQQVLAIMAFTLVVWGSSQTWWNYICTCCLPDPDAMDSVECTLSPKKRPPFYFSNNSVKS